jgi:hypothetical protein
MPKKGDIFLFSIIIFLIASGFVYYKYFRDSEENTHKTAVIKQDDKVIRSIDLNTVKEPEHIKISESYNISIYVESGRIRFEEADCPDLTCVKTGWLSKKGDTAVCLPNRTIIKIEGSSEKLDGITY